MYCDHCKRFYPKIKRKDGVGEPSLALTDFEGLDATLVNMLTEEEQTK